MPRLRALKRLRESRFLSQADLAALSGVARMTISRIELGKHEPQFSTIRTLADALDVTPDKLVGEPDASGA
jgi:transcriptional regulator with XRE-family HTH domain